MLIAIFHTLVIGYCPWLFAVVRKGAPFPLSLSSLIEAEPSAQTTQRQFCWRAYMNLGRQTDTVSFYELMVIGFYYSQFFFIDQVQSVAVF